MTPSQRRGQDWMISSPRGEGPAANVRNAGSRKLAGKTHDRGLNDRVHLSLARYSDPTIHFGGCRYILVKPCSQREKSPWAFLSGASGSLYASVSDGGFAAIQLPQLPITAPKI